MSPDPHDPQVQQADGTFVSQSELVRAALAGSSAPLPKLLDAAGHEAKPDVQLLGPGGAPIGAELEIPDQRLAIDELEGVAGRTDPDEIAGLMARLHAEEAAQEAEFQAQEHPYPEIEALIPWDAAPALSWALSLRWRDDGALEAYWYQGDQRLPAYELDGGAPMEFFYACQQLPGGDSSDIVEPESVAFMRRYEGGRPGSPWDFDFAVWWFTWFGDVLKEQSYVRMDAPRNQEEIDELAQFSTTGRDISNIKIHPHPLAYAIRGEIVQLEKGIKHITATGESA